MTKGELRLAGFLLFFLYQKLQEGAERVTALNIFAFFQTDLLQSSEVSGKTGFFLNF